MSAPYSHAERASRSRRHYDGNTYGPVPNNAEANSNCQRSSYGIDAMRQFLIAFT
jgi:hypothetical protein